MDRSPHSVRIDLPLTPDAVHRARRAVAALVERWQGVDRERASDAGAVTAELVANAVLHGGRNITLELSGDADHLLIGVRDGSAVLPAPREADAEDENGRGLAIVRALSQAWGVDSLPGGHKRVWARVGLQRPD